MLQELLKKVDIKKNANETSVDVADEPKINLKNVTVKEIHEEFDSAEQRILDKCNSILAELKIPTETQIERKANMLKQLGFVNVETVQQAQKLEENNRSILNKIEITNKQVNSIKYFKQKYPLEKFITVDELERICNKYNLIHAPAKNYIKDIPEKNVLEMVNVKKLNFYDELGSLTTVTGFDFWSDATVEYKKFIHDNVLNKPIPNNVDVESESSFRDYLKSLNYSATNIGSYYFKKITCTKIDKSGFFIAAPLSHFNLDGLEKKSKHGYFNVEKYEVKDPVVFEYCKEGLIRIVTKWGTEDDKSYLDPTLQNEILN